MNKKKKEKDYIYRRVGRPLIARKEILKAAIEATKLLQRYENFKVITEEKQEKLNKLRNIRTSLLLDLGKLNNALPKIELPGNIDIEEPSTTIKEKKTKKALTESDKLQDELESIEHKLMTL